MDSKTRSAISLLVSLIVLLIMNALLDHSVVGEATLLAVLCVTLVTGTIRVAESPSLMWWATSIAVLTCVVNVMDYRQPGHWQLVREGTLGLFYSFTALCLFMSITRPGSVSAARLYSAGSLYLLMGMSWSTIFRIMETAAPGSFVNNFQVRSAAVRSSDLLYFSLATLTTAGYGDILPVSPLARICAALEAVTGVLYTTILIARLVSAASEKPEHSNVA
jgi:voltage-gated potassium channel